jgi:hypothetical protein
VCFPACLPRVCLLLLLLAASRPSFASVSPFSAKQSPLLCLSVAAHTTTHTHTHSYNHGQTHMSGTMHSAACGEVHAHGWDVTRAPLRRSAQSCAGSLRTSSPAGCSSFFLPFLSLPFCACCLSLLKVLLRRRSPWPMPPSRCPSSISSARRTTTSTSPRNTGTRAPHIQAHCNAQAQTNGANRCT